MYNFDEAVEVARGVSAGNHRPAYVFTVAGPEDDPEHPFRVGPALTVERLQRQVLPVAEGVPGVQVFYTASTPEFEDVMRLLGDLVHRAVLVGALEEDLHTLVEQVAADSRSQLGRDY